MAKKHKNFDDAVDSAIDELLKNQKSAMKTAVKYAFEQAQKDIMSKAKTCLEEYYDNYPNERYDRTETLQYAFLPYSKIKYGDNKISGGVGVEYSAHLLTQFMEEPEYYTSKDGIRKMKHTGYYGSSKHQPVDAQWVIDNYLRGVHPATNGGITPETSFYYEVYDSVSPDQKMNTFLKEYKETFDANVLLGLLEQISKKL